jgi:hypothetical protein
MAYREGQMAKPGVTFEVDDRRLMALLHGLSPAATESAMKDVMRQTSRLLVPLARREAQANGLGRQGRAESPSGWSWTRLGRIPKSIAGGKVYRSGGAIRTRLYVKAGKRNGLMGSAPHANPVIAGYRQKVPVAGGGSRFTGQVHPGRSVFGAAYRQAPNMLDKAVMKVIDRVIRKARRTYG